MTSDCSKIRSVVLKVCALLFLALIIPLALSWSGYQNQQSCETQTAYCCWIVNGNTNCVTLLGPSCPSNQQMYCGSNLTSPITLSPSWKYPLGVTSAVIMGISGGIWLILGCFHFGDAFLTAGATAGRTC